ncbi:MAG: ATP phosphoribosyltransferase, partial [Acidobacteria bacterium]|nr:ATP phosphoribosyltransferase [Acidobacteriota bacterium]
RDILDEQPAHIYEPLDLGVGRCRMVVARRAARPLPEPPLRLATKYPSVTARHFGARGVPLELIRLSGAIELAPAMDLADAVVDLVETGATLRDNGLVEDETLFESTARVVVNRASFRLRPAELQAWLRRLEAATEEG